MSEPPRERWVIAVVALLVALRVAGIVWGLQHLPSGSAGNGLGNDARRFHDIASATGRPYRDFQVEVPPIALGAIHLLDAGAATSRDLADRLPWAMLGCDLLTALILWKGWSRRIALSHLILGAPLALFIYFRLDPLSVLLSVLAVWLVRRGTERAGGVTLAVGAFVKIWPIVLLPLLAIERGRRALIWAVGGAAVGGAAWVVWGGMDGPMQVLTMRHAIGWEVEGPIGMAVWAATGDQPRFAGGAYRVGTVPGIARVALAMAVIAMVWFAWARSRDDAEVAEGWGATTAVAATMVLATVLSHQYILWLLPWVALTRDRRVFAWTLGAGLCAAAALLTASGHGATIVRTTVGLVAMRDVCLIAVLALGVNALWRRRPAPIPAAAST